MTLAKCTRFFTLMERFTMLSRASRSTVLIFSILASAPVMVVARVAMMPR